MLYVTVKLYGRNGIRGEFREYEAKALAVFRKHGGEVVVAYAPTIESGQIDVPDEIQILRISDREAFQKFMDDSERIKMSEERNRVIRKTEAYISDVIINY
jgi:uncharacterized protein (DUF1330 family)